MNKEVYKHLLHTYGQSPALWLGFLAAAVQNFIVRVYVVIIMAQVTSDIAAGDITAAKHHTLLYLVVYIGGSIIGTAGELLSFRSENIVYEKIMLAYYTRLTNKDMAFYRDNQTGYLASAFRQYLDGMIMLTRLLRGDALGSTISVLVPPIVMLFVSVKVGLIAVGIVIVQLAYIVWSSAKANKYRLAATEIYRKVTGEVSDEITNMVAFKSGGVEKLAHGNVARLAKEETHSYWLRHRTTSLLNLPRNIVTAIGTAAAIYLIIASPSQSSPQSLGLIILTLTYMFQIVRNVAVLPAQIAQQDDLVTKIYPALRYLSDEHETIRDIDKPQPLHIAAGAIDITNVAFSYPSHSKKGNITVFADLNIQIRGGEQVGVVGLSGAGKSTLANLLLRFDDIDSGSISIDGIDIRTVRQSELRQKIAYVPQEPLLFHRSVRENIAYYNAAASDEDVIAAAKAAHAHEFITKLPDGYETLVGERGVKLSGGQKQRVAIARAVLKKTPIMIFDEATSALDSESEQIIQRALPEIIGKQTAIVVAHRLSTVAGLDRIIVMHEGKIVEQGSHTELLTQKGRYYSLWQKQTSEF